MNQGHPNPPVPPSPPEPDDPRLAIPEALRDPPRPPTSPPPRKESFGDTAKAWGIALDLVFTTIGGLALGWLFDYWRHTAPWGAIIGLGLGFLTAAVRMIRSTLKAEAREKAERERKRKPGL